MKRPLKIALRLEALFTTEQFTFGHLWKMFVPLVFDQLFIFIIGVLSSAMVSSSGEAAISAVTMVGSVGFIVSALFNALSTGGMILVAQARGSGDDERVRVVIGQTILLSTLMAVVCCGVFVGFADPLVRLLYPKAEPLLLAYAAHYLLLISLSYIPFALFNAVFYAFRGLGDAKSSLTLTITINTVHLTASFVLINLFDLGVTGSGLAYILARSIGAAVAVAWMFKIRNSVCMRAKYVFRFAKKVQASILRMGVPLAMEQVLFQAGMLLTQMFIATLPTATIAANAIAGSVFGLFNAVAFSLTSMVTTVCGQCVGAKRPDLATVYCRSFIKAGRYLLLFTVIVLCPLLPLVLRLYTPSAAALPQIYLALLIGFLPAPLLWCDANIPGAAMRSAGDTAFVTIVSLFALWTARVAAGYLLTIPLSLGVAGVWMSMGLEWALRALLLRPRLASRRWLRKALA